MMLPNTLYLWTPLLLTGVLGLVTGFLLGTLGAGGSLLALPAFLYIARLPPPVATATSLVVVGLTSMLGGVIAQIRCYYRGCLGAEVNGWVALIMAIGGLLGTQIGVYIAAYLVPTVQQGLLILILLWAAILLVKNAAPPAPFERDVSASSTPPAPNKRQNIGGAVLPGIGVGVLTGILGVGGGFLLVPTLRFATGLPVRQAATTSLWVIAANAGFAFIGYFNKGICVDWKAAGVFLVLSMLGLLCGQQAAQKIRPAGLQRGFATLLLTIAGWTFWTLLRPFL